MKQRLAGKLVLTKIPFVRYVHGFVGIIPQTSSSNRCWLFFHTFLARYIEWIYWAARCVRVRERESIQTGWEVINSREIIVEMLERVSITPYLNSFYLRRLAEFRKNYIFITQGKYCKIFGTSQRSCAKSSITPSYIVNGRVNWQLYVPKVVTTGNKVIFDKSLKVNVCVYDLSDFCYRGASKSKVKLKTIRFGNKISSLV